MSSDHEDPFDLTFHGGDQPARTGAPPVQPTTAQASPAASGEDPLRSDPEFLVRHRMPRPIARTYETVCFALNDEDVLHRSRWCARVALRFVNALHQAAALAAGPADAPELAAAASTPPTFQATRWEEREHLIPAELRHGIPYALQQLAGVYGANQPDHPRAALREALTFLAPLAHGRLVVVEPAGLRVLLGPNIEYRVRASWPGSPLPPGTVLFLDPRAHRFLDLSPLLVWERKISSSFGQLLILSRLSGTTGHYVEEGVPGCPGRAHALTGRPGAGALPADWPGWAEVTTPPARFRDGQELDGELKVQGLIWRGGTSDVYAARATNSNQPLVIKTFEYEEGVYDENFWRFFEEERLAQRVEHPAVQKPRIVRLTGTGPMNVAERVERGALADLLEINGSVPLAQALDITAQLLSLLEAIHAAGILHNDLKPDNLLFDDQGTIRLIDFGIATSLASPRRELRAGVPVGTRGYCAPEVLAGEQPSVRSDLWSAGQVLAQLIGATPPGSGSSTVLPLPGVSSSILTFLRRCLALSPTERFPSAAAARAALDAVLGEARPIRAVTLDIEGTLITNFQEQIARPQLRDFLTFCQRGFDRIFIYTLLSREDARTTFLELARQQELPDGFPDQYEYVEWPRGQDGSRKDLRRCRLPLVCNAIVDDSEPWIPEDQTHRWIQVPEFGEANPYDRGLYLAEVALRRKFGL